MWCEKYLYVENHGTSQIRRTIPSGWTCYNYNLFYRRVYHDIPVTYIVWQTKKFSENTLFSKIKVTIGKSGNS